MFLLFTSPNQVPAAGMQEVEGANAKGVKRYLSAALAGGATRTTKHVYARLADEVIDKLLQVCRWRAP